MISSARRTISCIFVVLSTAICVHAQNNAQKVATASISGKVTVKGKPAVGIVVTANVSRDDGRVKRNRARTDQTGSYRITNLPAGTYTLLPLTPALVPGNQSDSVVVAEGEQVEDVNLELAPGGVITGKITDSEGEPIIGERVTISPVSEHFPRGYSRVAVTRIFSGDNSTDDRGVYRVFGLPAGKYRVSAGSYSGIGNSREHYKETFYPSVSDVEKATIIEVTEGSETNNIDIVLGRPVAAFKVAGRVVDETGRPVPNIRYGVGRTIEHNDRSSSSSSSVGNEVTNANGEFRLENLVPGRYTIFTTPTNGSDMASASVSFQVIDRDLTDLIIKTTKSSSMSGVVVIDGAEKPADLLSSLRLCASEARTGSDFAGSRLAVINQDGTFRIIGLRSGTTRLWVCSFADNRRRFEIVRVERDGVLPGETINVKEAEEVAGIRVVVKYSKLTGAIRGQVKVENGELTISQISLSLWPLDENLQPKRTASIPTPQLDARGRFFVEGLAAGTYRLTAHLLQAAGNRPTHTSTQQLTIVDDTVTEVTLTVKPEP